MDSFFSDNQQTLESLLDKTFLFRSVFDQCPNLLLITDIAKSRIILVNKTMADFCNTSGREMTGRTLQDFPMIAPFIESAGNLGLRTELTLDPKKGELQSFSILTTPLSDHQKWGKAILISVSDITKTKRIEKNLSVEQNRIRALIDKFPAIIYVKDTDGRHMLINPGMEKLLSLSAREILGKNCHEIFPAQTADRCREIDQSIVKNQQGVQLEETFTLNHEQKTFITHKFPIFNTEGTVSEICGISIDITDRKKIEDDLQKSEASFRTIAESIPQHIWSADASGSLDYVNSRFLDYTGITLQTASGWGWLSVVHPDDIPQSLQDWNPDRGNQPEVTAEGRIRDKNGNYRWFAIRSFPVKDPLGNILRWFGTNTDIHEQKLELEARDEFVSLASHELKTPITTLVLQLQILERRLRDQNLDREKEILGSSLRQLHRLTRLIDNLLDVSKIRTGQLSFNPAPLNLTRLVTEVTSRSEPQLRAAGCKLVSELESNISGQWDQDLLEQVLTNLLSNAAKYAPNSEVKTSLKKRENHVIIAVEDQGPGIPLERQSTIFDRYERAASTKEVTGMGLGLYISKIIVEKHGGKICLQSKQGQGAHFEVELPLQTLA